MIELSTIYGENESIASVTYGGIKRKFGRIPKNPCQASSMMLPWEVMPCLVTIPVKI